MGLIAWILVFVVSLAVLVKSADYFTSSAEKIGLYFGLPSFVVGVTIVALGTSLPELFSSIIAVMSGASEIVVGNVLGSNITNIFLVLGIAAIVGGRMKTTYELITVDLPFLVGSAFFLAITLWDGVFSLGEAVLCLILFFVYVAYTLTQKRSYEEKEAKKVKRDLRKKNKEVKKEGLRFVTWIILVLSAVGIYFGAEYTVRAVMELSKIFNVGAGLIAVSAVAFGTSLPELVTSVVAAKKGLSEIAVGNVLGSNIFNALFVMGVPAFFGKIVVPSEFLFFNLIVMIAATLLYFFITQDKLLVKWEGWVLVLLYVLFIVKIFNLF